MSDSLVTLWRRKGLTAVLLLLTLAATAGMGVMVPWTYQASITETLVNSQVASKVLGGGNPYLSFNAAMVEMANVLTLRLTDSANISALKQQGYTASIQAQVLSENPQNEEPFIQISVTGSSKESVFQTLKGATASLKSILAKIQAGVPAKSLATLDVIADDSLPVRSTSAKIKPLVGILGVGLMLTFLIPQAVEGAASRRRKRRAGTRAEPESYEAGGSYDMGQEADPGRFRPDQVPLTRSENFQRQMADQVEDDYPAPQLRTSARQAGRGPLRPDYGPPNPEASRYPENGHL